jgi:hypothetical protein
MGFFNKRKMSKSFRYYISEIIVVVIGIFIAIQLNNFNESRKNSNEEQKSLKRILSDLKTDKLVKENFITYITKSGNYLKNIAYNSKSENLDSLYINIGTAFNHYRINPEYINLKSSGKLNLISNDTIRYNLVNYYEVVYDFYDEISEQHKEFIKEDITEYFKTEFPSDTTSLVDPVIVKTKLNDLKFNNLIISQISYYKQIRENVKTNRIEDLINRIEIDLQK